jgi:hypothetical protein
LRLRRVEDRKVARRRDAVGRGGEPVDGYIQRSKLIPLDRDAAAPLTLIPKCTRTLPLEPLDRALIAHCFKDRFEDLQNAFIMLLDPVPFLFAEQGRLDELRLDGDLSEPLKAEPAVTAKLALRVDPFDDERALDAYTPVTFLVETRFVGQHVARLQGDACVAKRLWALVYC